MVMNSETIITVDNLVKEYLVWRGFSNSSSAFEAECKKEYDRKYKDQQLVARQLENDVFKLYLVICVHNKQRDKSIVFFEKMTDLVRNNPSWNGWFALPYLPEPAKDEAFQKYFSKHWQELLLVSLHNFLSVAFTRMSLPSLAIYVKNALKAESGQNTEIQPNEHAYRTDGFIVEDLIDDFAVIAQDNSSLICSGRGICRCGVCDCFPRANPTEIVSGPYCECDNFNCPRHDRLLCGGHGKCACGYCECEPGWTARACECPISTDSCLSKNGKICNDHGTCNCGMCFCEDGYYGPHCDICPTCPTACVKHEYCVMCQQWGTGTYNERRCDKCPFKVIPVKELPVLNVTAEFRIWGGCQFIDPYDDCTFYFLHYDDGRGTLTVWVKEEKDCRTPLSVIVLIVIAGIVLLGLLLCLWKSRGSSCTIKCSTPSRNNQSKSSLKTIIKSITGKRSE